MYRRVVETTNIKSLYLHPPPHITFIYPLFFIIIKYDDDNNKN